LCSFASPFTGTNQKLLGEIFQNIATNNNQANKTNFGDYPDFLQAYNHYNFQVSEPVRNIFEPLLTQPIGAERNPEGRPSNKYRRQGVWHGGDVVVVG